jgi:peptide/nickel transport system substrate-binding protein
MQRRGFLQAAAAAAAIPLMRPAIATPTRSLSFVPQANLNSIDPVWTTATTTRNFGLMVFETLFGRDENMNPKLQMLERYLVEDDGRRWTMKLREGLLFHDGTPVLARDCVASLGRWSKRDPMGATIMARTNELVAADDRTIILRLKKPFPSLPKVLSKNQTSPIMVPERLAATDPFKQMPEAIGCGPFRHVAAEQVIGSQAVFERFEKYVPRQDAVSFTSGGRHVHLDRVVWHMIPDPGTAANALATGEIDWVEMPLPDLIPMLRLQPNVVTGRIDPHGIIGGLRPNHLITPTNNPAFRRAMMAAIDQREVMTAVMGDDRDGWIAPVGYLQSGKPEVDDAGMDAVRNRLSKDAIKALLDKAGYHGERVVLLHPTDQSFYNAACSVVAHALTDVGITMDDQAMDWGTVVQRRTSKEPLDKGGWSLFTSGMPAAEYRDPLLSNVTRSNGKDAWFGWPDDPHMERIYETWVDTANPAEQIRLERDFQLAAFDSVPFIPLGRYLQQSAWSKRLSAILRGPAPLFWNIQKA